MFADVLWINNRPLLLREGFKHLSPLPERRLSSSNHGLSWSPRWHLELVCYILLSALVDNVTIWINVQWLELWSIQTAGYIAAIWPTFAVSLLEVVTGTKGDQDNAESFLSKQAHHEQLISLTTSSSSGLTRLFCHTCIHASKKKRLIDKMV